MNKLLKAFAITIAIFLSYNCFAQKTTEVPSAEPSIVNADANLDEPEQDYFKNPVSNTESRFFTSQKKKNSRRDKINQSKEKEMQTLTDPKKQEQKNQISTNIQKENADEPEPKKGSDAQLTDDALKDVMGRAMLYKINPSQIYQKRSGQNLHLPPFLYRSDYEFAVFESIKNQEIAATSSLINILQTTEIRGKNGQTPLIYASRLGKTSAVKLLLMKGADIYAKDNMGKTAYQVAKNKKIKELIEGFSFRYTHNLTS